MTDKELIKQEIERLDNKYRELRVSGTTQQAKEADLVVHVLLQISNFIDSLPEESASEDLEEAAENYGIRQGAELKPFAIKFFKAGAKWQKQQMMKDAVSGYVSLCHDYPRRRSLVAVADSLTNLKYAEKVKIIILKTEQQ